MLVGCRIVSFNPIGDSSCQSSKLVCVLRLLRDTKVLKSLLTAEGSLGVAHEKISDLTVESVLTGNRPRVYRKRHKSQ